MDVEQTPTPPPKDLPIGVVIITLIAAMAIIGFIGYRCYLSPSDLPGGYNVNTTIAQKSDADKSNSGRPANSQEIAKATPTR